LRYDPPPVLVDAIPFVAANETDGESPRRAARSDASLELTVRLASLLFALPMVFVGALGVGSLMIAIILLAAAVSAASDARADAERSTASDERKRPRNSVSGIRHAATADRHDAQRSHDRATAFAR
jgi:hypothetical protein